MSEKSSTWLVAGLGNPGAQYASTRHNVGHMAITVLAERMGEKLKSHRSRTHIAQGRLGVLPGGVPGPALTLAISDSFMNTSGGPISRLATFLGITPDHILIVHDDLDIEEHVLRLKKGGGEGGHNGLKSLTENLGTRDYNRLRVGIGRPPGRMNPADYVLATIASATRNEWGVTIEKAADVVEDVVINGFSDAQQRLHSH